MLCYRRRNTGRSGAVLGGVLEPPSPRPPPFPINLHAVTNTTPNQTVSAPPVGGAPMLCYRRRNTGRSGAVLGGVLEPPSPRTPPVPLNQQRASRQLLGRSGAVLGGVLEPPSPRTPPVPLNLLAVTNTTSNTTVSAPPVGGAPMLGYRCRKRHRNNHSLANARSFAGAPPPPHPRASSGVTALVRMSSGPALRAPGFAQS